MKKRKYILALTIIMLLIASSTFAQLTPIGGKKSTLEVLGGLKFDSTATLPVGYNNSATYRLLDSAGRIWYDASTKSVWYHSGTTRSRLANQTYVDSLFGTVTTQNQYIFKVASVDMQVVSNTSFPLTAGLKENFIITDVRYVVKSFAGTVSTPPEVSIGVTGAGYNDIVNTVALPSTPTLNNPTTFTLLSTALSVNPSTTMRLRVSTAVTFGTTGEYAIDVYVKGFYETLQQ